MKHDGNIVFADALKTAPQPFVAISPNGFFMQFNHAYVELTGYLPEELYLMTTLEITPLEYHEYETMRFAELLRTEQPQVYQKDYVRKDGTRVPVEMKVHIGKNKKGDIEYYFAFVEDITERQRLEEDLRHIANHDALTGLPNRRFFIDIITVASAQALRHGAKMALLLLDLDRFKEVNDTLGHETGDLLLREVAARVKSVVRKSDTVCRTGGDEFNVILADITHVKYITNIARKIIRLFRTPFLLAGHELHVTTSIGISIYPDDSEDIDTIFRYADIAMYHAKERGRNALQFYNHEINTRSIERIRMEGMLRQTINRGELVVHYQPQVNTHTRRMICSEALVRWNHPERGILEPKHFIPAAEDTGFITDIDEWVMRAACAQIRAWLDAGLLPVCIAVNLSARAFQDPDLTKRIAQVLSDTGTPPKFLDIEITESLAMSNIELTIDCLNEISKMGVRTSIDDFGTGYSSLSYLKKLPIQKLKIDQSFIRDITVDQDDRAIIRAVIAMAHNLNIRVLAEGVESEGQFSFLRDTNCDEAQGYLFSKPLPGQQFRDFMIADR